MRDKHKYLPARIYFKHGVHARRKRKREKSIQNFVERYIAIKEHLTVIKDYIYKSNHYNHYINEGYSLSHVYNVRSMRVRL